jgi:hypothetical protein
VEDIFRDQFNRRVDSNDSSCIYLGNAVPSFTQDETQATDKRVHDTNDYSCIYLGNAIPSLLLTTLVVKSLLMDPPRSEIYLLRAVVLVLAAAL